jgi:hypothetical protein
VCSLAVLRVARSVLSAPVDEGRKMPMARPRDGKPAAALTGVESADPGTAFVENSRDCWDEVEVHRRSETLRKSIEGVRAEVRRARKAGALNDANENRSRNRSAVSEDTRMGVGRDIEAFERHRLRASPGNLLI